MMGRIFGSFFAVGEVIFIVLAVLALPVWFPLLIIWIVIDLPYRRAMRNSARPNEYWIRNGTARLSGKRGS